MNDPSAPLDCGSAVLLIEDELAGRTPPARALERAWTFFAGDDGIACTSDVRWRVVTAAIAGLSDARTLADGRAGDEDLTRVTDLAPTALVRLTGLSLGVHELFGYWNQNSYAWIESYNAATDAKWRWWWSGGVLDRDTVLEHGVSVAHAARSAEAAWKRARLARAALLIERRWDVHEWDGHPLGPDEVTPGGWWGRKLGVLYEAERGDRIDGSSQLRAVRAVISDRVIASTGFTVLAWPAAAAFHLRDLKQGDRRTVPPALLARIEAQDPAAWTELLQSPSLERTIVEGDTVVRVQLVPGSP